MKSLSFTHPHVVLNLYEFLLCKPFLGYILKNVQVIFVVIL